MKKSIALVAAAFGVTSAFAQDLTSKKGEPFLPEAKEWSIGIDATPFLNYVGNFFGKGGQTGTSVTTGSVSSSNTTAYSNQAPTFNFANGLFAIQGKYFKDASTAYRATLRIGLNNQKNKNAVAEFVAPSAGDVAALSEAPEQKFDVRRASTRNIVLGVGLEKRRGKTRLQGIYGADLLVWGGNTRERFKYGNDLTQSDNTSTAFNENLNASGNGSAIVYTTDWSTQGYATNVTTALTGYQRVDGARALKRKTNGVIGVGVRAFIGVEYFVAPKVSIGGEFGWGLGYQLNTKNKATWDAEGTGSAAGSTQTAGEIKTKDATNGGGQFIIDTDRNATNSATYNLLGGSGNIRLNFYF
jgi:hypothetical protein